MRLTLNIYRNRANRKTAELVSETGHGYRLCGIELLPGDPLLTEVEFGLEELLRAIPGLRYEPPEGE